jgi:ribosomal protein S18 acetylase RimI-like enzyme
VIRPLTAFDAAAYRDLMLAAYAREPDAFTSTPDERAAEPIGFWERRIGGVGLQDLAACWGAFDAALLVGSVALEMSTRAKVSHKGLVIGMVVAPNARRRALGRGLLDALLAHAMTRPTLRVLTLTVTEGNGPATALYESVGFRVFGVEPLAIRTDRGFATKLHMQLELPSAGGPATGR